MNKRKPEPGTAEYAPDKVTPAPQPKKKTGTTNRLRDVLEEAREYLQQRGITQPWEDDPDSC
jgi:hypothetical protein